MGPDLQIGLRLGIALNMGWGLLGVHAAKDETGHGKMGKKMFSRIIISVPIP